MTAREQVLLLQAPECVCGREKKQGHAFCYRCFARLPPPARDALYVRVPAFGESYERAVELLKSLGALRAPRVSPRYAQRSRHVDGVTGFTRKY